MTALRARLLPAAAALLLAAPAARADALDRALVRNSGAIFAKVRGLNAKSVAVLKFEVKVREKPATFDAGPANAKLAQKLENLLVLANDPKSKLFVLADAGTAAAAAAAKAGAPFDWRTPEGRRAFADLPPLPLAWDRNQSLRADAFVTGTLELSKDLAETKVTLHGFTRANPAELVPLLTVAGGGKDEAARPLHTDRSVLALAGIGFAVGARANGGTPKQADAAAVKQALELLDNAEKAFAALAGQSPVRLEVLLNGEAVPLEPDGGSPGAGRVAWPAGAPRPADAVEFRLTNTSPTDRFAVLLAVNGKNTNARNPEDDLNARDPRDQRKWVLEPNESVRVRGFYTDAAGKYQQFGVLAAGEAERVYDVMLAKYRGRVTMYVYAERPEGTPTDAGPAPAPATPPATPPVPVVADPVPAEVVKEEVEAAVLTLGWGDGGLEKVRTAGSLEKAQEELRRRTGAAGSNGRLALDPVVADQYRRRGLIVPSEQQRTDGPIRTVDFRPTPHPVASLDLRYYQPKR